MGFRDLRAFNLAMLAKQRQRMIQESDSLLYRCFKARYFLQTSFLEAVKSPNSSYVWKSMLAALPILKSSHCWRVVNGCSIRVQGDKWIPNFPSHRIRAIQSTDGPDPPASAYRIRPATNRTDFFNNRWWIASSKTRLWRVERRFSFFKIWET